MRTRYDWSKVPDWVQFIAEDESGRAYGYRYRPVQKRSTWSSGTSSSEDWCRLADNDTPHWGDSLEQRPLLDDTRESIIAVIKTVLQQIEVDAENYGEEIACSIIAERSADMILERLGLKTIGENA
jgi:hypothetical protein